MDSVTEQFEKWQKKQKTETTEVLEQKPTSFLAPGEKGAQTNRRVCCVEPAQVAEPDEIIHITDLPLVRSSSNASSDFVDIPEQREGDFEDIDKSQDTIFLAANRQLDEESEEMDQKRVLSLPTKEDYEREEERIDHMKHESQERLKASGEERISDRNLLEKAKGNEAAEFLGIPEEYRIDKKLSSEDILHQDPLILNVGSHLQHQRDDENEQIEYERTHDFTGAPREENLKGNEKESNIQENKPEVSNKPMKPVLSLESDKKETSAPHKLKTEGKKQKKNQTKNESPETYATVTSTEKCNRGKHVRPSGGKVSYNPISAKELQETRKINPDVNAADHNEIGTPQDHSLQNEMEAIKEHAQSQMLSFQSQVNAESKEPPVIKTATQPFDHLSPKDPEHHEIGGPGEHKLKDVLKDINEEAQEQMLQAEAAFHPKNISETVKSERNELPSAETANIPPKQQEHSEIGTIEEHELKNEFENVKEEAQEQMKEFENKVEQTSVPSKTAPIKKKEIAELVKAPSKILPKDIEANESGSAEEHKLKNVMREVYDEFQSQMKQFETAVGSDTSRKSQERETVDVPPNQQKHGETGTINEQELKKMLKSSKEEARKCDDETSPQKRKDAANKGSNVDIGFEKLNRKAEGNSSEADKQISQGDSKSSEQENFEEKHKKETVYPEKVRKSHVKSHPLKKEEQIAVDVPTIKEKPDAGSLIRRDLKKGIKKDIEFEGLKRKTEEEQQREFGKKSSSRGVIEHKSEKPEKSDEDAKEAEKNKKLLSFEDMKAEASRFQLDQSKGEPVHIARSEENIKEICEDIERVCEEMELMSIEHPMEEDADEATEREVAIQLIDKNPSVNPAEIMDVFKKLSSFAENTASEAGSEGIHHSPLESVPVQRKRRNDTNESYGFTYEDVYETSDEDSCRSTDGSPIEEGEMKRKQLRTIDEKYDIHNIEDVSEADRHAITSSGRSPARSKWELETEQQPKLTRTKLKRTEIHPSILGEIDSEFLDKILDLSIVDAGLSFAYLVYTSFKGTCPRFIQNLVFGSSEQCTWMALHLSKFFLRPLSRQLQTLDHMAANCVEIMENTFSPQAS
ncbi:neurofilament heavy polypeptide-like isoform X2 [Artemia franciscana]|uniref:neurofilament heavy polypeptide-like isoform X2 n=1 Tax=Artemia franciscana TaxID=6661 RepID=UPI0032DB24AD